MGDRLSLQRVYLMSTVITMSSPIEEARALLAAAAERRQAITDNVIQERDDRIATARAGIAESIATLQATADEKLNRPVTPDPPDEEDQ
jgi:hypothetical protein